MHRLTCGLFLAMLVVGCSTSSNTGGVCGDGVIDPGEQCDDGANNGAPGDACTMSCELAGGGAGHIQATWQVATIDGAGNTTPIPCPSTIDTAALHTVAASPDGTALDPCTTPDSNCFIDLFNCSDGQGTSAGLPPQNYLTWIELTNHDGSVTYATSTEAFVDITNADQTFSAQILDNGGYFKLAWTLVGATSNQPLSCSQTDAATSAGGSVETTATVTGTQTAFSDKFNCEDHFGYSAGLPQGNYTVEVDALNSSDQAISDPTTLTSEPITAPNGVTDLGSIMIPITGM